MSEWFEEFNSYFWITIGGILSGCFILACKTLYRCKIDELQCCCFKIKRNIQDEMAIDLGTTLQSINTSQRLSASRGRITMPPSPI
jgi:hypothetical protein